MIDNFAPYMPLVGEGFLLRRGSTVNSVASRRAAS